MAFGPVPFSGSAREKMTFTVVDMWASQRETMAPGKGTSLIDATAQDAAARRAYRKWRQGNEL